ncbi:hypothetical protein H4S01_003980 [Coemansia sp. RSA 2610]|nr:hypothetical protein H4S01_003980 [Coemansia sp. RSA 2610]
MDIGADIAQLPGVDRSEPVSGGLGDSGNLLYRHTSTLLEVRSLGALSGAEALATLSTTQLQVNTVEDLEIVLVQQVTLNRTAYLVIFAREQLSETARLYTFEPFTLGVHRVAATVPYRPSALHVSAAMAAGRGSSCEWEFAVVCFGLDQGRVLLGNLTVDADGSQLTGITKFAMDAHRCAVADVRVVARPDGSGRVLALLGMASGSVAAAEYEPFGGGRVSLVATAAGKGPVACIAAAAVDEARLVVCTGHAASVAAYSLELGAHAALTHVATQTVRSDDDGGVEVRDIQIIDARETASAVVVAALATSGGSERGARRARAAAAEPGAVAAVVSAWTYDAAAGAMDAVSRQATRGADAVLAMRVSGRALQVEVVTARRLLLGDALAGGSGGEPSRARAGGEWLDGFAYPPQVRGAVGEQRRRMDGELFVDLLLRAGGVGGAYPPRTAADQAALAARVVDSGLDGVKQGCIAYYLALDGGAGALVGADGAFAERGGDAAAGNARAQQVAADARLPRHFVWLVRGYWLLDHAQAGAAMPYLADPAVVADWAGKVLGAAVAAGRHADALQFLGSATAQAAPRLGAQAGAAPAVMEALLHADLPGAFGFQRTQAPALRRALLAQLFAFALSAQARRATADQLATLAFDGVEEAALAAHCLGEGAAPHARDFLALHYVNCGRFADAVRLFRAIERDERGRALDAPQRRKRAERRALAASLCMLLPAAQRGVVSDDDCGPAEAAGPAESVVCTEPAVPLSASKAARRRRAQGLLPQSPSHPLARVLLRQMSAEKPAPHSGSPAPLSGSPAPLSGSPVSRRAATDAPEEPAAGGRSPFARARQSAETAKRYNLRARSGLTPAPAESDRSRPGRKPDAGRTSARNFERAASAAADEPKPRTRKRE